MDPEIAGAGCGEQQPLLPKKLRPEEPEEATHKLQLTALCTARLVDPVTYTQAFPYVNALVAGLGITDDPSKVGLYSGLVVGAYVKLLVCAEGMVVTRAGKQFHCVPVVRDLPLGENIRLVCYSALFL
jgi:hypothetical protein